MEKLEIVELMYRKVNEVLRQDREENIPTDYICRNSFGEGQDLGRDAEIHVEIRGKDPAKVIEEFHTFCKPQE